MAVYQKVKFVKIKSVTLGSVIVDGTLSTLDQISLDQTMTNI